MFKDETGLIVPVIVSEELWDTANAILKKRSEDVKNRQGICNHPNLLTGKMYCTHCGAAFYRRDSVDRKGSKNSKWVCSGKIKNGADSCPTFHVYEDELKPLLLEVFQDCSDSAEDIIGEYMDMYRTLTQGSDLTARIQKLEQAIDIGEKKKQKLLMFNAMGELADADFLAMNRQCTKEIEQARAGLAELLQQRDSAADFKKHMDTIRRVLREATADAANGLVNKEFVDEFIDKTYVTMDENGVMQLKIKLFTGEITDKYLSSLRSRTGHISKKMIEAYEQGLQ